MPAGYIWMNAFTRIREGVYYIIPESVKFDAKSIQSGRTNTSGGDLNVRIQKHTDSRFVAQSDK